MEIIAHRGASFTAPENTLAAFRLGWEEAADACELDIRLTRDGEIVALHDANTRRVSGVSRSVAKQTLAHVQTLDAGAWKGPAYVGEKVPTLPEVIATLPSGRRLFIEIKCGTEVLPALHRVLAASGKKPEQLVLMGFSLSTLKAAKRLLSEYPAYWVVRYAREKSLARLISRARRAGLDGLNLSAKFPLDAAAVATVKDAGLHLVVWTVDDPTLARRLMVAGIDGLTTNRPGWLRDQLC